jgi:hypothetical protein
LSEYIQFAAAMILMIVILIGSYWFVIYSPAGRSIAGRDGGEERNEDERPDERPDARRVPRLENRGDRGPTDSEG